MDWIQGISDYSPTHMPTHELEGGGGIKTMTEEIVQVGSDYPSSIIYEQVDKWRRNTNINSNIETLKIWNSQSFSEALIPHDVRIAFNVYMQSCMHVIAASSLILYIVPLLPLSMRFSLLEPKLEIEKMEFIASQNLVIKLETIPH